MAKVKDVAKHYKAPLASALKTSNATTIKNVLVPLAVAAWIAGTQKASKTAAIAAGVSSAGLDLGAPADAGPDWTPDSLDDLPPALAARVEDMAVYAQSLASQDSTLDPDDQAEMIAGTSANASAEDAAQASYSAGGVEQWELVTDDDPCQQCQDAADGGPYDVGDGPDVPVHSRCDCESQPLDPSESRSSPMADKYNQADRDSMAKKGQAMSDGSYPIKDADDLANAIQAVGRGGADHDAIRKHIMARAKALGLSSKIPSTWNSDGSLQTNAASKTCPTCHGDGKIKGNSTTCPDCDGTGEMESKSVKPFNTVRACREAMYGGEFRSETRGASEVRRIRQMDPDQRLVQKFEMREIQNGTGGSSLRFTGYASVVERAYEVSDAFGPYMETITRTAFNKTLSDGADVSFLVNHSGATMARTKSGTLQLSSDSTGLYAEATLNMSRPDVQIIRAAVEDGDMDEMSFAFRATRQEWNEDYTERSIQEVNMNQGDVSLVNYGANPATGGTVALRSKLANQGISAEEFIGALVELRAGAAISASNMKTLSTVLDLVQGADTNVDHALVILSNLMGVKNPDIAQDAAMDKGDPSKNTPPTTSDGNGDGEPDPPSTARAVIPDYTSEARQRLAAIRGVA